MKVERITTNQGNYKNQPSHKAVNLRFLKKAIDKYNRCYPHQDQGHLIEMIDIAHSYQLISTQDVIDTLKAIKPYANDALVVIGSMLEMYERYKKSNQ